MSSQIVICGDNIDVLKSHPDNSVDSIVTDCPYGLGKEPDAYALMQDWLDKGYHEIKGSGFMGKSWDSFVPQPIFWKEVFRVLKHGGHVIAFFGTRTYDWGVMAMRFAGFEIRDSIQWNYATGFPKSHNISKAIDKMGGESLDWFIEYILEVAKQKGISKKDLTMLFPSKNGKATGWLWNKQNNQSITLEQYNKIKDFLNLPFNNIEEAKGEVIARGKSGLTKGSICNFNGETEFDITAPATDAAKQWDGFGTALKPAVEPIVLARKPLESGLTIVENILKWGTGGINIDGCRVSYKNESDFKSSMFGVQTDIRGGNFNKNRPSEGNVLNTKVEGNAKGRFPANIIFTHHPDCECVGTKKVKGSSCSPDDVGLGRNGDFTNGIYGAKKSKITVSHTDDKGEETVEDWQCHQDCPVRILDEQSGEKKSGASRFFFVAKASQSERNKGLLSVKNNHVTIKPIRLMQYLVRLVTPPNGVCLDPFNGSGTTGIACKLEGFNYIGVEQNEEDCIVSRERIANFVEESTNVSKNKAATGDDKELTQLNLFKI